MSVKHDLKCEFHNLHQEKQLPDAKQQEKEQQQQQKLVFSFELKKTVTKKRLQHVLMLDFSPTSTCNVLIIHYNKNVTKFQFSRSQNK
jgi:hypothetical protein